MPKFKKAYTRTRQNSNTVGDTMTKQSFNQESDINFIMRKYKQTGFLDPNLLRDADYMDAPEVSFQKAMNIVVQAQDDFDALPSEIRKKFANSPSEFLDFVGDESNIPAMREMGLLPPLLMEESKSAQEGAGESEAPATV